MHEVIDNFLNRNDFLKIKELIADSSDFPWYYSPEINKHENSYKCYFTHVLFSGVTLNKSEYFKVIEPLVKAINPSAFIRIKCNLYTATEKLITHASHTDYSYKHQGALFCLNNCDGGTIMEDDKLIQAVENRIIFFDPSTPHASTTTTNAKSRVNINLNYFK